MKPAITYNNQTGLYEAWIGELKVCEGTHDHCNKELQKLGYYVY